MDLRTLRDKVDAEIRKQEDAQTMSDDEYSLITETSTEREPRGSSQTKSFIPENHVRNLDKIDRYQVLFGEPPLCHCPEPCKLWLCRGRPGGTSRRRSFDVIRGSTTNASSSNGPRMEASNSARREAKDHRGNLKSMTQEKIYQHATYTIKKIHKNSKQVSKHQTKNPEETYTQSDFEEFLDSRGGRRGTSRNE